MAVKIRMKRLGAKKKPFYRIVVSDVRAPRDGRFIEELGYYNPVVTPKVFKIDEEKLNEWIKKGAKPTETVAKLLKTFDILETKEVLKAEKSLKAILAKKAKLEHIEKKKQEAAERKKAEESKAAEEAAAAEAAAKDATEEAPVEESAE